MKTYRASRNSDGKLLVTVDGKPLNPRYDLKDYIPFFDCGTIGCSCLQLALAILADYTHDDCFAREHHEAFYHAVVFSLPREGWTLTGADIASGIEKMRKTVSIFV